jgi:hypothetical protein
LSRKGRVPKKLLREIRSYKEIAVRESNYEITANRNRIKGETGRLSCKKSSSFYRQVLRHRVFEENDSNTNDSRTAAGIKV